MNIKVESDSFKLDGKHYLAVKDFYNRYFELVELRNETTNDVVCALKAVFTHHGVSYLKVIFIDYGLYYNAAQFNDFAHAYGFRHDTPSPK